MAMELVDDRLRHGEASHYRFLVAELDGMVTGYACWGPILGTVESADLYWIAVDPSGPGPRRRPGAARRGRALDRRRRGGPGSTWRPPVGRSTNPTRAFYLACGYHIAAELEHFYAPGDAKVIFLRVLGRPE